MLLRATQVKNLVEAHHSAQQPEMSWKLWVCAKGRGGCGHPKTHGRRPAADVADAGAQGRRSTRRREEEEGNPRKKANQRKQREKKGKPSRTGLPSWRPPWRQSEPKVCQQRGCSKESSMCSEKSERNEQNQESQTNHCTKQRGKQETNLQEQEKGWNNRRSKKRNSENKPNGLKSRSNLHVRQLIIVLPTFLIFSMCFSLFLLVGFF